MMYVSSPSPVPTSVIHQNISCSNSPSNTNHGSPSPQQVVQQAPPSPAMHPHHMPPQAPHVAQHTNSHNSPPASSIVAAALQHHPHHPHHMPAFVRQPPLVANSSSSSPPIDHPHDEYPPHHDYQTYERAAVAAATSHFQQGASVLNLSRRAHSPYEVSSGGSVASSVEDDHDSHADQQNNSLPLKLRHKSHLGDKDAATALLALHNIKQEPNPRASPPWDGEGSSDERDSGISIGAPDWTATIQRKIIVNTETAAMQDKEEENIHLKSQLARLESEVATIKNMMILNANNGATAAAQ